MQQHRSCEQMIQKLCQCLFSSIAIPVFYCLPEGFFANILDRFTIQLTLVVSLKQGNNGRIHAELLHAALHAKNARVQFLYTSIALPQSAQLGLALLASEELANFLGVLPHFRAIGDMQFAKQLRPIIRLEYLTVKEHVQQPVVLRLFELQRAIEQNILFCVVYLNLPAQLEHSVFLHGEDHSVLQRHFGNGILIAALFIQPYQNTALIEIPQRGTETGIEQFLHGQGSFCVVT